MEDFAGQDAADIFRVNGNQRDRCAAAVNELHLVCCTVLVNVNDGADVTTMKFLVFGITVKYDK